MSRKAIEEAIEVLEDASAEMLTETGNENYYGEAITILRQALETKREWVGLTADEIWKCNKAKSGSLEFHICYAHQNVEDFAEAIEAKLKEKNQ